MPASFADIALPVPLHHSFTYIIPPDLVESARIGVRALVPFGKKQLTGIIIGLPAHSSIKGLRPLTDILDQTPTIDKEMLQLLHWMADYYFAPLGEVLRSALPQGLSLETRRIVHVAPEKVEEALRQTSKNATRQHRILRLLLESPLTTAQIERHLSATGIYSALNDMASKGWITFTQELKKGGAKPKTITILLPAADLDMRLAGLVKPLTKKQSDLLQTLRTLSEPPEQNEALRRSHSSLAVLKALAAKGLVTFSKREIDRSHSTEERELPPSLSLNPAQTSVLREIGQSLDDSRYKTFLLHGVTGSGKTQVYIESIRHVLGLGKTAIVLVPEISLTPQIVRRFRSHFGDKVAVMHSQMSPGERFDTWRAAREERVQIVIGPRSAIFAPLKNLGLLVVDEEHESSYKQYDANPRYHARDVAIIRATLTNAVVVL